MHVRTAFGLPALAALAFGSFGCGIISKDLDGEVRFNFDVNGVDDTQYVTTSTFDPNTNDDVKNNRDKVESGSVVEISLELNSIPADNAARIVAGQVNVKPHGAPDSEYIRGVGAWGGIWLYDEHNQPAVGEVFKLDLPADKIDAISNLVFKRSDPIDFDIAGYAYDDYGNPTMPTKFSGDVHVKMKFTVSAP